MKKLKVDETTNKIAGNHELLEETCSSTIVSQMPQMPKLLNNKMCIRDRDSIEYSLRR